MHLGEAPRGSLFVSTYINLLLFLLLCLGINCIILYERHWLTPKKKCPRGFFFGKAKETEHGFSSSRVNLHLHRSAVAAVCTLPDPMISSSVKEGHSRDRACIVKESSNTAVLGLRWHFSRGGTR